MICSRKIIILLPILFGSVSVWAQLSTSSLVMERMLVDVSNFGIKISDSGRMDVGALCKGKHIRVITDNNAVTDMGLVIFPTKLDKTFSPPVYCFIERYFQALLLKRNKTQQKHILREDAVTLNVNGRSFIESNLSLVDILQSIDTLTDFRLISEKSVFRAQWKTALFNVELLFPKQYDLILGRDKKELTQAFRRELESFVFQKQITTEYTLPKTSEFWKEKGVYADLGDTWQIPQMKSGRFMKDVEAGFAYVFNERMVAESLLNFFGQADEMNCKQTLKLTVKGYAISEIFDYSIDRFCAFMRNHSCRAYVGLETQTDTEITGTAMYVNRDLMYLHLLYFRFPVHTFKHTGVVVKATVYPYIPINNLTNLYNDNNPKDKVILDEKLLKIIEEHFKE